MNKAKKFLSVLTTFAVAGSMMTSSSAAQEEASPRVRIIIENNTLSAENGADWTGVLADEWVDVNEDTTAVSALLEVLDAKGFTQTGAEYGYITEINGLSAEDGGSMGGWMLSIDDWFTDEGISAYTISSGKLESGDEIRLLYSCAWGGDLDYDWSGADTSLKNVVFSAGGLTDDFSGSVFDYTLSLPANTDSITVRPQVLNKAYRAKVYKNSYTPAEKGTDYKPGSEIEVSDGDVVIIGVASPSWMQSNYNNAQESVYQFHVESVSDIDPKVQEAESLIAAIGDVDAQSRSRTDAARSFYDSLTDEQKSQVSNYDILTAAEEELDRITPQKSAVVLSQLRENAAQYFGKAPVFGNEWDVIALARLDLADEDIKNSYIGSVRAKLEESSSAKLSASRSTVNSGVVTALTALGADPSDFYGYDLTAPLSDTEYVTQQGVNGAVYALIALSSHGYAGEDVYSQLIKEILDAQEDDGGWTIDTWTGVDDGSDADMTAMAVQALAPFADKDTAVSDAVGKALLFLENNQNENAGFVSYGSEDCESCAQVITALCSLGININESYVKNGSTVYDALMRFYNDSDKGFAHFEAGESNYLSSYQGYIAAAALYRYENSLDPLFDMSGTEIVSYKAEPAEESELESSAPAEESKEESKEESTAPAIVPDEKPVNTGDNGIFAAMLIAALAVSAAFAFGCGSKVKR